MASLMYARIASYSGVVLLPARGAKGARERKRCAFYVRLGRYGDVKTA